MVMFHTIDDSIQSFNGQINVQQIDIINITNLSSCQTKTNHKHKQTNRKTATAEVKNEVREY